MPDDDKTVTDKATEDTTVEPTQDVEAEIKDEPKAEKPTEDVATPAANVAEPAGTDQQGRQLYSVKCSNCGKQTEVPFKPSGDRPVYCRDCYMQKKNARG